MNEKKHHKNAGGVGRVAATLLVFVVLGVAGFAAWRLWKNPELAPPPPNYEEVRQCVKSLVESQSSYCVHKTGGRFAADMDELGFVRDRGEVMLKAVWNANFKSRARIPHEGYFFTTFALDEGRRAVALGVPADGKPPYFIALYGEHGVSMAKARGTSVYRSFDASRFTSDLLSGKTTTAEIRALIDASERVPAGN